MIIRDICELDIFCCGLCKDKDHCNKLNSHEFDSLIGDKYSPYPSYL